MSNFTSLAGPGITNVQSTMDQYRLNGEMPPDIATQEQALNRRQQIANLLIQRGMQGTPGGQMVGRFFVKSSPYQNLASLGEVLAGVLGTHFNEQGHKDLAAQQKEATANAVRDYIRGTNPVPEVAPSAPIATPMEGTPSPESMASVSNALANAGASGPASQQETTGSPYFTQADGANPGIGQFPSTTAPAPVTVAGVTPSEPPGTNIPGVTNNYISQPETPPAPSAPPSPVAQPPAAPPMQGPVTPGTPARPRSQAEITEALAKAYTSQIPGLKEFAQMQALSQVQAQEKQANREFIHGENRDKIDAKLESDKNHIDMLVGLKIMTLEEGAKAKKDADERHADLMKTLNKSTTDTQKQISAGTNATRLEAARIAADAKIAAKNNPGMSATAQKELIQTDEELLGMKQGLSMTKQARELNEKAMGFMGAGVVAGAGSLLPESMRPEMIDATNELNNLVQGSLLPQLKSAFGGNPTEGERKVLFEIGGSAEKSPSVRKGIFDRAEAAFNARIKMNTQKAEQLRSGKYFTNEGGLDTGASQMAPPVVSPTPGTVAPFNDPEKERRYQEFKATHK